MLRRDRSQKSVGRYRCAAAVVLAGVLAILVAPASATDAPAFTSAAEGRGCVLAAETERAVTRIAGGDTLHLDDGSEIRLAGILVPRRPLIATGDAPWLPAEQSAQALSRLVLGRTVAISAPPARRADRYGRRIAHAFVVTAGERHWVQGRMLAEGHARAHALDGDSCFEAMLRVEGEARAFGRGLWSNAAYRVRRATATGELMRLRSTFQLVEGRVISAASVRGAVYLNFGSLWRTDFTAGMLRRRQEGGGKPQVLLDPAKMEGRTVRVRGWIERSNGPFIEITHPSQIEVLDAPAGPVPSSDAATGDKIHAER